MEQREAWQQKLAQVDYTRLVYLDETGAKTNMTRLYARAQRGQRALDYARHGHWSTTTLVAALSARGAIAPMVLDGLMDRVSFEAYVQQVLIPELPPNAIVVMDNLSAHKSPEITRMLQAAGAELWYLPPYSPDLNPIEQMWSKVKSALRSAKARTEQTLFQEIARALADITPQQSRNCFQHSCVCIQS